MSNILDLVKDKQLTYEQKVIQLARETENTLNVLNISEELKNYIDKEIINDLFEGNAPYRPRYILPYYEKFLKNGSEFLNLPPASNLLEAVNYLLIIYKHTPSITSFPVFLGNIDKLLNPFIENEETAYPIIKMFLTHIDRTLTDSFVHANIGPEDTLAGRLILKAERELVNSVPNLTLKYNENTPDDFAREAIMTGLTAAKPYFANHAMFVADFGEKYGIASCYNGLPEGGGSYTLVRINIHNLAKEAKNIDDFFDTILPKGVRLMCDLMDERIKFLVEEIGFFESNFLFREALADKERFSAMFGVHGLAEGVNLLLKAHDIKDKFGNSSQADNLGVKIISKIETEVKKHTNPHCKISDGHFILHAQCGIGTDKDASPGCRIPAGEEPEIHKHILQASLFHKFFPAGISDIFTFDENAKKNPYFLLDIIKGSIKSGFRIFSFYTKNADLIRITGYLVKRSEMEKFERGEQNLKDTVALGAPSKKALNIDLRKIVEIE